MANPVQQGTINRLRAAVVYANFPELTVTAPYLSKEAISLTFEGNAGVLLPTMTGGVTSPEPYQMATVTMHILRSQALSTGYKNQIELDSTMGSVNIIPDANTLDNYQLENCILLGVQEMTFDGNNPGFVVRLSGIYYVNSALWTAS